MNVAPFLFWLVPSLLIASRFSRLTLRSRYLIAAGIFLFGLLPLGTLNLMQHWASFVGQLAVTTVFWCVSRLQRGRWNFDSRERVLLSWLTVLMLVFYVLALGVSLFDPYRLGFNQAALLITLTSAGAIIAAYYRHWWTAWSLLVALLSYALQGLPSQNLWDYLLDPILLMVVLINTVMAWMPLKTKAA